MGAYKATIGLEVHAELKTRTKMFCASKNDSEEKRSNVNICPICMGHPGTLPVINREAVKHVLKVGVAVGGDIADFSEFDRKNYFYPDIPKGYQISQYKHPLITGGTINTIALRRIHLEEDTASSSHEGEHSFVNFNRAGVPLMELVTEPVIGNGAQAVAFAKEFQLLLQYLEVGDANMEKGEMRVEANISVSADNMLGTKVEVKNLNSFRAVERAIEFEIERQSKLLEKGGEVVQETRGFNEAEGITFSQRTKEDSHDYRYFPDPDLPKLFISEILDFKSDALKKELPELPWEKRNRYKKIGGETATSEFKISPEHIEVLVNNRRYGKLFDETYEIENGLYKLIANYIVSDISGLVSKFGDKGLENITPEKFAKLLKMFFANKISSRGAKDILAHIYEQGGQPESVAKEEGLLQESNEQALLGIIEKVVLENPSVVKDYRAGKEAALQYLIGQGMKESRGGANPQILMELLKKVLK